MLVGVLSGFGLFFLALLLQGLRKNHKQKTTTHKQKNKKHTNTTKKTKHKHTTKTQKTKQKQKHKQQKNKQKHKKNFLLQKPLSLMTRSHQGPVVSCEGAQTGLVTHGVLNLRPY